MKKIFISLGLLLTVLSLFSQNEVDALRYSNIGSYGTARSMAMGGAFGALGGDASSLSTNPAGMAVYRSSELTFSPRINLKKTKSTYMGNAYTENSSNFNLGNFVYIATRESKNDNSWVSSNFGMSYSVLKDFTNNIVVQSVNNDESMVDYFRGLANGNPTTSLNPFAERLAYDSWLYNESGSNQYENNFSKYGETQRNTVSTSGNLSEFAFSYSANYNNKLYLGATLAMQRLSYEKNDIYKEFNFDTSEPSDTLKSFDYQQNLKASGNGTNLKLGFIYRATNWARFGLAIHTPISFSIKENYFSSMTSDFVSMSVSPEKVTGRGSYELITPSKLLFSAAFIVMKKGLISIDYDYIDYSSSRLRSTESSYYFFDENSTIQSSYTASSNLKIGGEYMMGTYRLRGGIAYFGSPYSSSHINKGADIAQLSCGFGINEKSFFIDVAYVYSTKVEDSFLYESAAITSNPVTTNFQSSIFVSTIGFRF